MEKHHLLLGRFEDYLTGNMIDDTHDERYRQKIARLLVEQKGYRKGEIEAGVSIRAGVGGRQGVVAVDFIIRLDARPCMLLKYGPGSLVTRRRAALAASRLVGLCQVPVVVVTNGEDAEIMEGAKGGLVARGLGNIPHRRELLETVAAARFERVGPEAAEREARILYAFEVEGSCGWGGGI